VIASNTKGYGDIVESIQAGLSVDASVPEELSAAIIKLLSDEKSCKIMGENGRRFALANTWENKARFIEQFLLNIKR
jgi:glycosyltransferase involved in cell wall biosynthesis